MKQPNPWILFMGGLMLFQVAAMVYGIKAAPEWAKLAGALVCVACGILSMVIGIKRQFGKKPEPPKKVPLKRERNTERAAEKRSPSDVN